MKKSARIVSQNDFSLKVLVILLIYHCCISIRRKFSLFNLRFDEFFDFQELDLRSKVFDHFSLGIHKEFGEVPGDRVGDSSFLIEKFTIFSEIVIDRVSFLSIHINLLHHREFNVELLHKLTNLLRSSTFLSPKLIAWKSQNL